MKITVAFRCPEGCDVQRIDFDNLDDLLGNLSESGWPICRECGESTTHKIISSNDETPQDMTVEELISQLNEVKDKRQIVAGCIHGVEVGETLIVGIISENDKRGNLDDISVCWLKFREDSSIHEV